MDDLFGDPEGGYFMNASDGESLISRPKEVFDGAMPSGNSVAAVVLEELAGLTGELKWREKADRQLQFVTACAEESPAGQTFALVALGKTFYPAGELVCAAKNLTSCLQGQLREAAAKGLHLLLKTPDTEAVLQRCAPFTEAYPVPELEPVWYLCENGSCNRPVTDFKELNL